MDLLKCKLCQKSFDNRDNKPLVLPKCGHTFCEECIYRRTDRNKFTCTLDGSKYEAIDSFFDFPVNTVLLSKLEKEDKNDPRPCEVHGKPLEYFCMTDSNDVCANCALFGEHKNHSLLQTKELQLVNQNLITQMRSTLTGFKFYSEYDSYDRVDELLAEKLKEVFRQIKREAMEKYEDLKRSIKAHLFNALAEEERRISAQFDFWSIDPNNDFPIFKRNLLESAAAIDVWEAKNRQNSENFGSIHSALKILNEKLRDANKHYKAIQEPIIALGELRLELNIDEDLIFSSLKPLIMSRTEGQTSFEIDESQVLQEIIAPKDRRAVNSDFDSDEQSTPKQNFKKFFNYARLEQSDYLEASRPQNNIRKPNSSLSNAPNCSLNDKASASLRSLCTNQNEVKKPSNFLNEIMRSRKKVGSQEGPDIFTSATFAADKEYADLRQRSSLGVQTRKSLATFPHKNRETSLGSRKASLRNEGSVYTQNDSVWTFSDQRLSKEKFEDFLTELISAGKRVSRVNFINNVFDFDPAFTMKEFIKKPLSAQVTIDLRKNQFLSGIKKELMTKLIPYNIKTIA